MLNNFAFAEDFKTEQKECVKKLKPYKKQKWCFSVERKECSSSNGGAEWCDDQAEVAAENEVIQTKLDKTYAEVIRSLGESESISVSHSQEAWSEYVFAECEARAEMLHVGAGILKTNTNQYCMYELNKKRI